VQLPVGESGDVLERPATLIQWMLHQVDALATQQVECPDRRLCDRGGCSELTAGR